ncbi:MAG: C1 family peptidase [Methylomonas sp.]|jgi:hypothetical protein
MINTALFKQLRAILRGNGFFRPVVSLFLSIGRFLLILSGLMFFFPATKALAAEKHGMGFVPENPEKYAAMPEVSRYRAYFSPETDLSPYFPKPGNQGKQGSCVAWATAYAARSYLEARRIGRSPGNPERIFSPSFIFNQMRVSSCDDGGSISEALGLMKNSGVASLAEFPYIEGNCSRLPNQQVLSDASRFRIKNWKKIDIDRLDDIKGQIYAGNPVIFGMFVSDSFENLRQNQLYDDLSSPRSGGHAMVLVGYSEPKQAFKLINSWGGEWGDDGFGWVSYRAFKKWTQNAFVMQLAAASPLADTLQDAVITADVLPELEPEPKPLPVIYPIPKPLPAPKPAPLPVVVSPPSKPDENADNHAEVQRTLSALIRQTKCADLHGAVGADGHVYLTGFVGQSQDLAHIDGELKKLGVQVTHNTTLRPWPQCEALQTLRDVLNKPSGLKLAISGRSAAVLHQGDMLGIEVTTPSFPSYLYLTYIQANGEAIDLIHPDGLQPKPIPPDTRLLLGNGEDGGPKFTVSPPFGDEMLIAIASASPLFDEDLPKSQTEREYLTRFRQAFLAVPQRGANSRIVSAAMNTLITRAKP